MRQPIPHPPIPPGLDAPRPARAEGLGTGARVWLVRHAEVHADFEQTAYGDSDVPLSELGAAQTRALAERFAPLELALVVASPLERAHAMGRSIAAAAGAPLALDPRLREVSRGAWQGLPTSDFRERWHRDAQRFLLDPWRWKGHGGESDEDLWTRGWPCLFEAVQRARGGTLVLASHYNLIRALVTGSQGWSAEESFAFRQRPAHAALLVDAPGGWLLAARDAPDPGAVALEGGR